MHTYQYHNAQQESLECNLDNLTKLGQNDITITSDNSMNVLVYEGFEPKPMRIESEYEF